MTIFRVHKAEALQPQRRMAFFATVHLSHLRLEWLQLDVKAALIFSSHDDTLCDDAHNNNERCTHMACKITYEPAGLYAQFSGTVTPEDLADLSDAMQSPQCAGFRYRIADYTKATEFQIEGAHIAYLRPLEYLEDLNSPALLRIVVADQASIVAAFMKAQVHRERPEASSLFSTMEEARRWLRDKV